MFTIIIKKEDIKVRKRTVTSTKVFKSKVRYSRKKKHRNSE